MARITPALVLLVTLAFGAAPFLTPPFRGYDPAIFPVLIDRPSIQPAGYAFSIWGVIYTWLFVHAIAGLWRRADHSAWAASRLPLILAVALGAVWLNIAAAAPILATLTIWIMALGAIAAFLRAPTQPDRWLLSAPLAIFAGWLSAAAAVSLGVVLAGHGILSDTASATAMLALVLVIALTVQWQKPAMPIYGLTVIWALLGVIVANWGLNPVPVVLAALAIAAVDGLLIVNRRRLRG
ncbi:MAG: hypothetical protein RIT14_383 [Pseudomonadota bacterium]